MIVAPNNKLKNKSRDAYNLTGKHSFRRCSIILGASFNRGKSYPIGIFNLFPSQLDEVPSQLRVKLAASSAREEQSFAFEPLLKKQIPSNYLYNRILITKPIQYNDLEKINSLLGMIGQRVLRKTTQFFNEISEQNHWPLAKIEVDWVEDCEVKNWQYIWIILFFETDFDQADKYLHNLYPQIDKFATTLTEEEQLILQKKLFFDVRASLS